MFGWNVFIFTKQTITSCSVTETFGKVNFLSHDRVCDDRIRHLNHLRPLIVLSTKVNNLPFWKFECSQERWNDRDQAVGMVQAGMTHKAVVYHFNVSRITISRLIIIIRQTGRTNDRHRNGRPRVMSQRQDRHLRLIHLQNRMITSEDTARRTPGLANVLISGQTVCI
jgi:hypothetical protein